MLNIKFWFNIFCNVYINFFCFNVDYEPLNLYPYYIIWIFFFHILVSGSSVNAHTLLLYLFPILIDLNRPIYSWIFMFFSFPWLTDFLKKSLYDNLDLIPNQSFLLWLLHVWYLYVFSHFPLVSLCFLTFSIVTPKTALFINFKKNIFQNHFFLFFLVLYSYQYMFFPCFLTKFNDFIHFFNFNSLSNAF